MTTPDGSVEFHLVAFDDLIGWVVDDLSAAFSAYLKSCSKEISAGCENRAMRRAVELPAEPSSDEIRRFFETNFEPHRVIWPESHGLVTGYFEPVLQGSWQKSEVYPVPIYRKPPDLVPLIDDKERAKFNDGFTYMRETLDGLLPFASREEIETGALDGQGLDLLYLKDYVDAFFLHVQGSGLIEFEDGSSVRITYAAKNGHPYSSIGRVLIEKGIIAKKDMSLEAVQNWLRENAEEGRELMWLNKSFIFFRILSDEEGAEGPRGAQNVALTPQRSLAVDASIHALGTPIWVSAPTLTLEKQSGFNQLMVSQDVGSAIKGPERGDIYWGSGKEAGNIAGRTAHPANFFVFLPKEAGAET